MCITLICIDAIKLLQERGFFVKESLNSLWNLFQERKLSRRTFMKSCVALTAILGLPPALTNKVVAAAETKENLDTVSAITEVLIALAISQSGGMPTNAYSKVAAFIKPLVTSTRYLNGDIIAMPYPFDTNPKWPSGTKTIFKFQMQANEGYTYKEQSLSDMLQQGVLTVVMPRIE